MGRSPGFACIAIDRFALFRLGFPTASARKALTKPMTLTRRIIMQKARRHSVLANMELRPLVSVWFQVQYPPLTGVLPIFQSPYCSLSVAREYLALGDGPP